MIKAYGKGKNGETHALIGLSDKNLEKLREGLPINFPLRAIGIDSDGTFTIMWGETEKAIEEQLRQEDMLPP